MMVWAERSGLPAAEGKTAMREPLPPASFTTRCHTSALSPRRPPPMMTSEPWCAATGEGAMAADPPLTVALAPATMRTGATVSGNGAGVEGGVEGGLDGASGGGVVLVRPVVAGTGFLGGASRAWIGRPQAASKVRPKRARPAGEYSFTMASCSACSLASLLDIWTFRQCSRTQRWSKTLSRARAHLI